MEVDEETDSRKKLKVRKRDIIKGIRKLEGIKCFKMVLEEGWRRSNREGNMNRCRCCRKHCRVWRICWHRARNTCGNLAKGMKRRKTCRRSFKWPRTRRSWIWRSVNCEKVAEAPTLLLFNHLRAICHDGSSTGTAADISHSK